MEAIRLRPEIDTLGGNLIREISLFGQGVEDVIPLWFGESDKNTSPAIVEEAVAAMRGGLIRYQPNQGYGPLLEEIESYTARLYGPIARDRLMVTTGGMNALMICAQATVQPGRKVVSIGPHWPNLTAVASVCGARVETSVLRQNGNKWSLDMDQLLSLIDETTDALLINSPGNPTGWVASKDELEIILSHCRRTKTWIISDEVYSRLYYGNAPRAPSMLDVAEESDRVLVVNSFSKAWTMTGWRLGWIVMPPGLLPDFCKLNEFNVAGPVAFVQAAAVAALRAESDVETLLETCRSNRDSVTSQLRAMSGVIAPDVDGAFYSFFRVNGVNDSMQLARDLISYAGVGLAPGDAFGTAGRGWLRLCFAQDPARVDEALLRMRLFFERRDLGQTPSARR